MNSILLLAALGFCGIGLAITLRAARKLRTPTPSLLEMEVARLRKAIDPLEKQFGKLTSDQIYKILQNDPEAPVLTPPLVFPFQVKDEEVEDAIERVVALEDYYELRVQLEFMEEDLVPDGTIHA